MLIFSWLVEALYVRHTPAEHEVNLSFIFQTISYSGTATKKEDKFRNANSIFCISRKFSLSLSAFLTVPDARLPGLEGVVLYTVPGVADDFGVFPVLPVAVFLFLGTATVPLVTGQTYVGSQDPHWASSHHRLVGESELVVGGELVGLQPQTDRELGQIGQGGVQDLRLGKSGWKLNVWVGLQHSDGQHQLQG